MSFVAGAELKGTALVKDTRINARVTRHHPSLRTLYASRSFGARFSCEGGRNPRSYWFQNSDLNGTKTSEEHLGNVQPMTIIGSYTRHMPRRPYQNAVPYAYAWNTCQKPVNCIPCTIAKATLTAEFTEGMMFRNVTSDQLRTAKQQWYGEMRY